MNGGRTTGGFTSPPGTLSVITERGSRTRVEPMAAGEPNAPIIWSIPCTRITPIAVCARDEACLVRPLFAHPYNTVGA